MDTFACVYVNIQKKVIVTKFEEVSGLKGKMKASFHIILGIFLYCLKSLNKACMFNLYIIHK